jgi:putative tryptophan/tyrosine transport system substrate-binding protein
MLSASSSHFGVASLNRPGANITGVYHFANGLEAKRLGLLHEMVPKAATIAVLVNSNFSEAESQLREVQEAAVPLGVQLVVVRANAESDFDTAFSTVVQQRSGGLLVCASPSSTPGASNLSCWRHVMRCRRSMNGATSL